MADKKEATPGVKPTAEPGDEPATTQQTGSAPSPTPTGSTMDPNSAAVDAYRHPIEGVATVDEQTAAPAPASTSDAGAQATPIRKSAKES